MRPQQPVDIYVDTSAVKFSVARRTVYRPRWQTINWGGTDFTAEVFDRVELDVLSNVDNKELKSEAKFLRLIADAERTGKVRLFMGSETNLEVMGLPKLDSIDGYFFGADIKFAPAPVRYGRVIMGVGLGSAKDLQYEFLRSLKHARFIQLQKMTGAYQGKLPPNRNQLLDAFHLWCAEYNECAYFLTLDFSLQKVVKRSKGELRTLVSRPSEVADALGLIHSDFPHPASFDRP